MSAVRSAHGGKLAVLVGRPTSALAACGSLAWDTGPDEVIALVDRLRLSVAPRMPGPAEEALARLQQAMGPERCQLFTWAVDGLLQKAGAHDVHELCGSLWRLRCAHDPSHPRIGVFGPQNRDKRCAVCQGPLRPDLVLPGEPREHVDDACAAVLASRVVLAVETVPTDPDRQAILDAAGEAGAQRWEVHPHPDAEAWFDQRLALDADAGVPRLVGRWLAEAS